MKLDPTVMRNMQREDYRVLEAVEIGMKNHALVPAALIASLARLRHGGTGKILSALLRDKLLSHDRSVGYDGYRLTNSGYDILALHQLKVRKVIYALGDKIGTGKESDVYLAVSPQGKQFVLKFHRLGRTSFRDVKKKRDYFAGKKTGSNSWLFLSRMSALKEYAFMKALYDVGYPTPEPIGHSRHIVAMSLIRGAPLYQIHNVKSISASQAESIFQQSIALATKLVGHGLVHCDLNEFNLMVDLSGIQHEISRDNDVGDHYVRHSGGSVAHRGALSAHGPLENKHMDATGEIVTEEAPEPTERLEDGTPKPIVKLIDFPQMVSIRHPNAQELFERDVKCLQRFFAMKLKCVPESGWDEYVPKWEDLVHIDENIATDLNGNVLVNAQDRLDMELKASGFSDKDSSRDMELYYFQRNQFSEMHTENDEESEDSDGEGNSNHSETDDMKSKTEIEKTNLNNDFSSQSCTDDDGEAIGDDPSGSLSKETEERVKQRVKQHFVSGRSKQAVKGSFGSRNSNKHFHRGKRVGKPDLSY